MSPWAEIISYEVLKNCYWNKNCGGILVFGTSKIGERVVFALWIIHCKPSSAKYLLMLNFFFRKVIKQVFYFSKWSYSDLLLS